MSPRLRKNDRIGGFTLVELIVAVSVIATVAVVGVVYGNGYKTSQYNAKRLSDIDTLKVAADGYYRSKGDYPEPTGNRIYFDSNGAYAHSATGSYGVSSTATTDLFGAEFLAEVPNDPDTGNAYGYGKRKDGVAGYDFAAVDRRSDAYYAYVRGTYDATSLSSLIREYNGPGFVEDGKTDRLPYNPYEKKITAKIASYSGTVTVSPASSLTGELSEGDTVTVPSGGFAVLHVSDGTEARIGSATNQSVLRLESLSTNDSKGFLTKVRFALNDGEIWTKAPKLREDRGDRSELEIVSGSAVASVRGTVFGVKNAAASTDVTLAVGELALTANGNPVSAAGVSDGMLTVDEGGAPMRVSIPDYVGSPTVSPAPDASSRLSPWGGAKKGARAKLKKLSRIAGTYWIVFNNDRNFTRLVIPASEISDLPDTDYAIFGTGMVRLSFSGAYLPAYPQSDSDSGLKRLPLRFENADGAFAETEVVIPAANDFELDEDSIPQGWSMDCAGSTTWFVRLGCQPKNLVAYAPYDKFDSTMRIGDINMYDRMGRPLKIASQAVASTSLVGTPYRASFDRNAASASDSMGFRTTATGIRGVGLDVDANRDDFVAYDLSIFDINPSVSQVSVDVGVQLSAIRRSMSGISSTDADSNHRKAYLWSLSDGTSAYYKVENSVGGSETKTLVLENADGTPAITYPVPAQLLTAPNQKLRVSTIFLRAA